MILTVGTEFCNKNRLIKLLVFISWSLQDRVNNESRYGRNSVLSRMEVVLSRSGIKWLDFVLSAPRKLNPGVDALWEMISSIGCAKILFLFGSFL